MAAMLTYLRYALATFCFAASVGCLALWGTIKDGCHYSVVADVLTLTIDRKTVDIGLLENPAAAHWSFSDWEPVPGAVHEIEGHIALHGAFGRFRHSIYFPLWYPALIFALAGVAALRFRRQFSIRSALIAVSIVAALLGMAAAL